MFLYRISIFEEELKVKLGSVVPPVRAAYDDKGISAVRNIIHDCRTLPLYNFVRGELGTTLLSGLRTDSPSEVIEKVYDAISQGKLVAPLLQCVDGCTGTPGPFLQHYLG